MLPVGVDLNWLFSCFCKREQNSERTSALTNKYALLRFALVLLPEGQYSKSIIINRKHLGRDRYNEPARIKSSNQLSESIYVTT